MRYGVLLVMLACAANVQADTFKCQTPSGQIVFSDVPCAKGESFEKVRPSESAADPEAARKEVEKQRAYAEQQAAENAAQRKASSGVGSLPDYSSPPPTWPAPTPTSPSSSATR